MAVAMLVRYIGLKPREYDRLVATLGLDASPPIGQILHLVAERPGWVESVDVWQTREAASAFVESRLRPALGADARNIEVEILPLHNLFAPDMDAVERIGGVSLPGYVSSAVL